METTVTVEQARKLLGLKKLPEDPEQVTFIVEGVRKMIAKYGEEWVRQNAGRLRAELEFLEGM